MGQITLCILCRAVIMPSARTCAKIVHKRAASHFIVKQVTARSIVNQNTITIIKLHEYIRKTTRAA